MEDYLQSVRRRTRHLLLHFPLSLPCPRHRSPSATPTSLAHGGALIEEVEEVTLSSSCCPHGSLSLGGPGAVQSAAVI